MAEERNCSEVSLNLVSEASEKPSKSYAKTLKTKAEKAWKKRPSPDGKAKIEEGIKLMSKENIDLSKACKLFLEAEALCNNFECGLAETSTSKGYCTRHVDNHKDKANRFDLKLPILPEPWSLVAKETDSVLAGDSFAINSVSVLSDRKGAADGFWRTRFPPEPNGYMHIGHAKAMHFDFGMAEGRGETYLRFDDTNPSAEKAEYIDSILDSVSWLGYKPARVTYTSDYFNELYDLAVRLIETGGAYVCHMTKKEVEKSRKLLNRFHRRCSKKGMSKEEKRIAPLPLGVESPWRDRPTVDSLRIFEDMRCGKVDEGAAVLRMRGDLRSDISSMWDLAAYRVKKSAHPRTGYTWCIYPTYDFSHCIVDSLEGITHSFCDTNYVSRQKPDGPYYWLLNELDLYKPVTWEFGRCSLTYNVTSKRKLNKLVTGGHVRGWDDPRLLTIAGLRRRGYTASSINSFCAEIGTTRGERWLHYHKLEALIRAELADVAPRKFCVLDPLRIEITNHPGDVLKVEAPNHPSFPDMGTRFLNLGRTVFIERSDFLETDKEGFYGLAPGKTVRLLFAWDITCTGFEVASDGTVSHLRCMLNLESKDSIVPKGKLHWVSNDAERAEVRLYDRLLDIERPVKKKPEKATCADDDEDDSDSDSDESVESIEPVNEEDEFEKELNASSLFVCDHALIEPSLANIDHETKFQFTRLGYFCIDKDSVSGARVFNRTCTLRESSDLKALR